MMSLTWSLSDSGRGEEKTRDDWVGPNTNPSLWLPALSTIGCSSSTLGRNSSILSLGASLVVEEVVDVVGIVVVVNDDVDLAVVVGDVVGVISASVVVVFVL